uniref:Integrase catalytic domain-containing protein n=1 Tax=Hucho hucho TaxID=62062 RepID=A0A4W5MV71_9TELE
SSHLSDVTTSTVILLGIPLSDFAAEYGFCHVTRSPKFPQSNREAERHVQTVKNLLKKVADPYINGFSLAQLLMGRQLRTTVPTLPSLLDPSFPNTAVVSSKEKERRSADQQRFNKRHRVSEVSRLPPGKQVWVTASKITGTVLREHVAPRSYMVEVPHVSVRRNRHHLIPMDGPENNNARQEKVHVSSPLRHTTLPEPPTPKVILDVPATPRTRSGQAIVKPKRLELWVRANKNERLSSKNINTQNNRSQVVTVRTYLLGRFVLKEMRNGFFVKVYRKYFMFLTMLKCSRRTRQEQTYRHKGRIIP